MSLEHGQQPLSVRDLDRAARAKAIGALRNRLQLTQCQFGRLLGAHYVTVSRWETGKAEPTAYQIALLAAFEDRAAAGVGFYRVHLMLEREGMVAALRFLLTPAESGS